MIALKWFYCVPCTRAFCSAWIRAFAKLLAANAQPLIGKRAGLHTKAKPVNRLAAHILKQTWVVVRHKRHKSAQPILGRRDGHGDGG